MIRVFLVCALLAAVLLASSRRASAQTGMIQISWDRCSPIVSGKPANAGPMVAYVSVTNQSREHKAYQVGVVFGTPTGAPDAWRFDAAGCNAGLGSAAAHPPSTLFASCPPFVPPSVQQFTMSQFMLAPPPMGYSPITMAAFLGVSYANGGAGVTSDPSRRYHLAAFTFDHTFSVPGPTPQDGSACGGLDRDVCIGLVQGSCKWTALDGQELAFQTGVSFVMVNDGCIPGDFDPTPARKVTWGSIKSQYAR